jgi:hypothetical protein
MTGNHHHRNVHDHSGPAVRRESATYFTIHGTRTELAVVISALVELGEVIVTQEPEPCTEPGNADCHWLEIVLAGHVRLSAFFNAYTAALAAHN